MIAFDKIIKKQIISLFVFLFFNFCFNYSFSQVQIYRSFDNNVSSSSFSIKIENNELQIYGDTNNVIIKPKYHNEFKFSGVGAGFDGLYDTEEIDGAIITINIPSIDPSKIFNDPKNFCISVIVPLGYSAFFDTIPVVLWSYPFQNLYIKNLNGVNTKYLIKIYKTNKINDIVDYISHVIFGKNKNYEYQYYSKATSTKPFLIGLIVFFIFLICFILIIRKAIQKKRRKEEEQKQILDEERNAKKIAEEKIRKEKEKAEDKRIKEEQEQKRIIDEERKEKKIAEEKIRKEKAKAEEKRIKEEQEQKLILDEERNAKKIAEEKIRKEKEKEKQKAEDKRIKEEQEQKRILDEERKAKKITEEKRRKEEEKQNNGYYIEIDNHGKTEITGPFEEKKIKDLFDAGKLNLTSKIKKGVKTKTFSSLSTFKTFTEGLDDWL